MYSYVTMLPCVFVPDKLAARLDELGWDVDDLAERSGLNARNLERIRDGRRPTPYPTTVARIATALGCDMDDLMEPRPAFSPGRLTRLRAQHGLTLKALADKAGVSYRELCRLESGERQPWGNTVAKLAKALGCTVDDLTVLGREDAAA